MFAGMWLGDETWKKKKSVWLFSSLKAKTAGKRQGFASLVIVRKFKIDLLLFWSLYWNSIFHEISKHKFNSRHPSLVGIPVTGKAALSINMAPILMTSGWGSWVGPRILYHLKLSLAIPCFNTSYLPEVPKGVIYEEKELRGVQSPPSSSPVTMRLFPQSLLSAWDLNRVSKCQLHKI